MTYWCELADFPGYRVSDTGEVQSNKYGSWRVLKGRIFANGYSHVSLYRGDGSSWTIGVHRLVALTFVASDPNCPIVAHKNHDKQDNRASNLVWVSQKTNMEQSVENRIHAHGLKHGATKLTESEVIQIRKEFSEKPTTYAQLAAKYKVTRGAIWGIITRRTWKHIQSIG